MGKKSHTCPASDGHLPVKNMRNLGSHNPQEPFLATPRRRFLSLAIGWLGFGRSASWGREVAADASTVRAHALGLLYGSVLGDALGGPIEFLDADTTTGLCGARRWPDDRRLTPDIRGTLASTIPLLDYARLRPDPAPYGPWRRSARPGTITDDTRHKIVLLRALRRSLEAHRSLTAEDIALGFLEFRPEGMDAASIETLVEEGLREYRLAARWILGERDRSVARPVERLWGGVDNCSGQMMFPPLAIAWAGMPVRAYEQTFALDFIDTPMAKDITAAIVAGLSAVVGTESLDLSPEQRWRLLLARCLLRAGNSTVGWMQRSVSPERRMDDRNGFTICWKPRGNRPTGGMRISRCWSRSACCI